HDFNNMLAVVLGRCEVLLAQARRNAPVEHLIAHAEVIRQTALDGADAVKRLQLFSGASRATEREPVDVADVISDVVQFTRFRWRDAALQRGITITVETEIEPLPPLMSSAAGLRGVLANLVLHAADSLPAGGVIRLKAARQDDLILITLRAIGEGAADAPGARVFAPFTTPGDARRPALSAAQSMTVQLGGTMTVQADDDGSYAVVLAFPYAPAPSQPTPLHVLRRYAVLLVDDEPAVLNTTAALLRTQGHAVTTTPLAIDALARLQAAAADEPFDLLITDLAMPDMNGLQLVSAARAAGLDLPCIIVTGWDMDLDMETRRRAGVDAVLTKPFTLDELRAVIARAMGDAPA
ncbi:MAG: response regulator, partial [Gemmataceae bacterium]|nr:response regulator [Gemmataceae bacterium]